MAHASTCEATETWQQKCGAIEAWIAFPRGHKAVSSWFTSVTSSDPEAGVPRDEEAHVVLASLSRLAHARPLPEPSLVVGKAATGVAASANITFNLPFGPAGWSTVHGKQSLTAYEPTRDKETHALHAAASRDTSREKDMPGEPGSNAHRGVLSGHATTKGGKGERSSTQLDDALAARPLSLGDLLPGLKPTDTGSSSTERLTISRDLNPLAELHTAAYAQDAKGKGAAGEQEARAAGHVKPAMMPKDPVSRIPVRKSSSSGSLSSRERRVGGSISKSVSSSSLGVPQGRGSLRQADATVDSAGGVEAIPSGIGGDGKSSKWQFKFELSGILEPTPAVTGASIPLNPPSARANDAPPVQDRGVRKRGEQGEDDRGKG